MNGSTDHERDALVGDLATVTDEEWREAHERLVADIVNDTTTQRDIREWDPLRRQLDYVWSPGMPAREGGFEPDIAPPAGQWDGRLDDAQ